MDGRGEGVDTPATVPGDVADATEPSLADTADRDADAAEDPSVVGDAGGARVATDPPEVPLTVRAVQNTLTQHEQNRLRAAGMGRVAGAMASTSTDAPAAAALRAQRDVVAVPESTAPSTLRRVDADGRLKLNAEWDPSHLLGFADGGLEAWVHGPWLVLRQPAALVGATRRRNSHDAHLSIRDSTTRLCLSPAQLECLRVRAGDHVLAWACLAERALVLVNPAIALTAAPAPVAALCAQTLPAAS